MCRMLNLSEVQGRRFCNSSFNSLQSSPFISIVFMSVLMKSSDWAFILEEKDVIKIEKNIMRKSVAIIGYVVSLQSYMKMFFHEINNERLCLF